MITLRLCVDYRLLNVKTVADKHPIPKVLETLENLGGNRWFSTLDQEKAYHRGLSQAPEALQSFMERVIGNDLPDVIPIPYLNDVVCFRRPLMNILNTSGLD